MSLAICYKNTEGVHCKRRMPARDDFRLLDEVYDILMQYSDWNRQREWDRRVYFASNLERIVDGPKGKTKRVGPQEDENRRHDDMPLFTDSNIKCRCELFFMLLAEAISEDLLDHWSATSLDDTQTDLSFGWVHAATGTPDDPIFKFYSVTPPPVPKKPQAPAVWYFSKS